MIRRLITIAVLVGAGLLSTNPAYASHCLDKTKPCGHLIGTKIYYYTLNVGVLVTGVNGGDINKGVLVTTDIKVVGSATICGNPQTFLTFPGVGPIGNLIGQSQPIGEENLVKKDRSKNTFSTIATAAQLVSEDSRLREDLGLCKQSSGQGNWKSTFWQFLPLTPEADSCTKGTTADSSCYGAYTAPTGYRKLAMWIGDTLTLVPSGVSTGCTRKLKTTPLGEGEDPYEYPEDTCKNWMFVFLPESFAFNGFVSVDGIEEPQSNFYGLCSFNVNNEPNAPKPGEPYSVSNPPDGGWSGPLENAAHYTCSEISQQDYDAI